MHFSRSTIVRWGAVLAILALLASGVGAAPAQDSGSEPAGPIVGPGSWSDTLDDTEGLTWLQDTYHIQDRVMLGETETMADDVGEIWAVAEGSDGKFYMGADNAHLWSYDPATNQTMDLGAPVPDECET